MKHRGFGVGWLPAAQLAVLAVTCIFCGLACKKAAEPTHSSPSTLRVGYGLTNGQSAQSGTRQFAFFVEHEPLIAFGRNGRPEKSLAEQWTSSIDGLTWRIRLRSDVVFSDGQRMTAETVASFLKKRLAGYIGPPSKDIRAITALSAHELEFTLARRSTFFLEGLDIPVEHPESKTGTGPYFASSETSGIELHSNPAYYLGRPLIDRILVTPYASIRAAWADMLRDKMDMVYDIGADALDSLEPSNAVNVFSRLRNYSYVVQFNMRRPVLANKEFRRQLNAAIDRSAFIAEGLGGKGQPTDTPLWPLHWSNNETAPRFGYRPKRLESPVSLTCLFADAALERPVLVLQRQLAAVGVELKLELLAIDEWYKRVTEGDFDVALADALQGPMLFWQSQFWHSDAPYNWGDYKSGTVDAALDAIRDARTDDEYRAGVTAFQQAIVDDPPAIFLAWSERSRAVSTRFLVPTNTDRDVVNTLRLWKPVGFSKPTH